MKQLYIHSDIDSTNAAISLGYYWDCNGRNPVETAWEYIGDEPGLMLALAEIRDDKDAEFMHVINRVTAVGNTK